MHVHTTNLASQETRSKPAADDAPVVFLVDDDVSVRDALSALIRSAGWRPESFDNAGQFLSHTHLPSPSCLILDVNLPDLDGLELQKRIAADQSSMPIIFLTGYGDVPTSVKAMKAGAVEFLTKPVDGEILLEAVKQALDSSRSAQESEAERQALCDRYAGLRRREQEVMGLVIVGLLNKQIAYELGIAEITVKAHRGQVMRKMEARTLPDLVKMGARLGLGQPAAK
jgi:FixJ family two-component response regulator